MAAYQKTVSTIVVNWNGKRFDNGRMDLVVYQDGKPVAQMSSLYWEDLEIAVPTPALAMRSLVNSETMPTVQFGSVQNIRDH